VPFPAPARSPCAALCRRTCASAPPPPRPRRPQRPPARGGRPAARRWRRPAPAPQPWPSAARFQWRPAPSARRPRRQHAPFIGARRGCRCRGLVACLEVCGAGGGTTTPHCCCRQQRAVYMLGRSACRFTQGLTLNLRLPLPPHSLVQHCHLIPQLLHPSLVARQRGADLRGRSTHRGGALGAARPLCKSVLR
jgi:hypothetical protein